MSFGVSFNKSFRDAYTMAEQREAQEEAEARQEKRDAEALAQQRKDTLAEMSLPYYLRQTMGASGAVSGKGSGGGSGAASTGTSSSDDYLALEEIQTRWPDMDPAKTAMLADNPTVAPAVRDAMNEANEKYKNAYDENMPAEMAEQMLVTINEVGGSSGLSEDKIKAVTAMFGATPDEEYVPGLTYGDMVESMGVTPSTAAPVIDSPSDPLDTATKKYYEDQVIARMGGQIHNNIRQIRQALDKGTELTGEDREALTTELQNQKDMLATIVDDQDPWSVMDAVGPQVVAEIAETDPLIYKAFPQYKPDNMEEVITGAPEQPPMRVTTQEEYDQLPPGTTYIHPDGTIKRKK